MRSLTAKTLALLATTVACATGVPQPPPTLARFHFPTGLAVDVPYGPDAGPPHYLYVAGNSNFDQAASRGMVMAVNLDAYGSLEPPGLDAGWDGTPLAFPDIGAAGSVDPDAGWVYTDSLGGELRLAPTSSGGSRVILATRAENRVAFIDVDGGALACAAGDGGSDCLNDQASPPLVVNASNGGNQILDVFALSPPVQATLPGGGVGPPEVLVGHLRNISTAVASMFGYGASYGGISNPYMTGAPVSNIVVDGFVVRQSVDDPTCHIAEPVGPIPPGGVIGLPSPSGLFAVATGRFQGLAPANVQVLALPPLACPPPASGSSAGQVAVDGNPPTPQTIDLSQILKETDGRALTLSSRGDRVFALSIGPDALIVLRLDGSGPGGLLIHPSSVVTLPTGPSELLAIPRGTRPDGSAAGDLVAISCPGSNVLAFYDDDLGQVSAALPGVGDEPFAIVATVRNDGPAILPGVRLFVTAFGSGQIAVVDVPDLFDATQARVVAMLGTFEDTTASPVNPLTNQFLALPYGYSGAPGL